MRVLATLAGTPRIVKTDGGIPRAGHPDDYRNSFELLSGAREGPCGERIRRIRVTFEPVAEQRFWPTGV